MDVVLFGPPGAGKGTQAGNVCQMLNVPHLSTGDIFRKHLRSGTELGKLAKSYMEKGNLVPDQVVFDIVASRLSEDDALHGVLFDGYPRTVPQAELLVNWLRDRKRSVDMVINLQVPDEVIISRLAGRRTCAICQATYHVLNNPPAVAGVCDRCGGEVVQRKDDQTDAIVNRIKTYHSETSPVLSWMRSRVLVLDVDANRTIGAVTAGIAEALPTLHG